MGDLTLLDMVAKMALAEAAVVTSAHKALDMVAAKVETSAKAEFGIYQPETGPFPEWAELAESTQSERERLGYTPNDPLMRDGTLRDSIGHETGDWETVIGSTSDIMPYHEFGTEKMPPRPVLGPALVNNKDVILKALGGAMVGAIVGDDRVHTALGYDDEITT